MSSLMSSLRTIFALAIAESKTTVNTRAYKLLYFAPFAIIVVFASIVLYMMKTTSNKVTIIYHSEFEHEATWIKSALELRGTAPYGHSEFDVYLLEIAQQPDRRSYSNKIQKQELLACIEILRSKSNTSQVSIIANPTDDSAKAAYERMLTTLSFSDLLPDLNRETIKVPSANIDISSPLQINDENRSYGFAAENELIVGSGDKKQELDTMRVLLKNLVFFALVFATQSSIILATQPLAGRVAEENSTGDLVNILLIPNATLKYLLAKHLNTLIVGGPLMLWYCSLVTSAGLYFKLVTINEALCYLLFGLAGMQIHTGAMLTFGSYAKNNEHANQIANPFIHINSLLVTTTLIIISRPESSLTTWLARFPLTSSFAAPIHLTLASNVSYPLLAITIAIMLLCFIANLCLNVRLYDVQNICALNVPGDSAVSTQ